MTHLQGLTVLVLGLGDSGLAMAAWCARHGAAVRVWDSREQAPQAQALALAVPAATPPAVVEALNRAVREAVAQPAVQERLARAGMRVAASSPAELQALLTQEIARWGEVIRRAKIEPA